ncbi:Alpha/Beta hydrolase protein [Elsinoe ampelina]|uniref:Alpha/Beta hydrolase protein n=1 Tax=Elsinoe ampelina TaxID=302913 RepID=A0A6A6GH02_9PEZI|nr:Alpha/Beta hydrolase protein [Elsinoe ampelina]
MKYSIALLALSASVASALQHTERQSTLNWVPCEAATRVGKTLRCASLDVPLDYTSSSSEKLRLALYRIPALKQPAKGSILFNFGGPGVSTGEYFTSDGYEFPVLSNNEYDLVGFDPRGTGLTIPYSCFSNDRARAQVLYNNKELNGGSQKAIESQFKFGSKLAEACQKTMAKTGQLIGTSFVAQDMLQIVEALNEDGLLRFWGFSYGTVLGSTFASMYPDKVEKMILDGNVNIDEWYTGINAESGRNSDDVAAGFFSSCAANPTKCALAESNLTAQQLETKVFDFIYSLQTRTNYTILGQQIPYAYVLSRFFNALYAPKYWPVTAQALKAIMTRNATLFKATLDPQQPLAFQDEGLESFYGISCSDGDFRASTADQLADPIKALYKYSFMYGELEVNTLAKCAQWPFLAKDREVAPYSASTKSPILFIGNTYDPITPLASAFNTSSMFPGSAVLQHNGYGHCSSASPSLCTARWTQAYWANGTLPPPGTVCQPDIALFSGQGWSSLLPLLDNMNSTGKNYTDGRGIGENLPTWKGDGTVDGGSISGIQGGGTYGPCPVCPGGVFGSGSGQAGGQNGNAGTRYGNGQGSGSGLGGGSDQGGSNAPSGGKTPISPVKPFTGGAAGSVASHVVAPVVSLLVWSLYLM